MPDPSPYRPVALRSRPEADGVDRLTGTSTRPDLIDRLVASVRSGAPGRLLFIDVDGLRRINGRLGRWVGDEVLRQVADRLAAVVGSHGSVVRLGGDRFAVHRPGPEAGWRSWAGMLSQAVAAPLEVGGVALRLTFSAAVVRLDGAAAGELGCESLLDRAELAVEEAGAARGVDLLEVDLLPAEPTWTDLDVARRLVQAVEDGDVVAAYQPVVDLDDEGVVGAEALARWRGAPAGYEGPAEFLALAEAIGLLPRITDAILAQACRDFGTGLPARAGWWVSVNLGAEEATDPDVVHRVDAALAASDLTADRLVVEVSERVVPDPASARSLAGIADLGVRLAIDDFGSGWSSLAQLQSLPIEVVKVDRSLVAVDDQDGALLLMATVSMAEALGLEVVAEGIELGRELQLARVAGIPLGQGFLWGPGGSVEDLASVRRR